MKRVTTLDHIPLGIKTKIINICDSNADIRRLSDMGVVTGSIITPVFSSPFADPRAYLVKDTLIAIRNKLAMNIKVSTTWGDNNA